MDLQPAKWTPRRKALYDAAQEMGQSLRDARPSWNFFLVESVFARPRPDFGAVPRNSPMGTYVKRAEWVSLRDHGFDSARDGDTFAVDRLTYGGNEAFYIAGDGRIFVAVADNAGDASPEEI
jgi:hypothetical protein